MRLTRLQRISKLFGQFQAKCKGKESLLTMVDDVEIAERVYNSNAIENSTLSLPETEKILLQLEISRHISLREVFEAKNLAQVYEYIKKTALEKPLTIDMILLLHKMLITNIRDDVAGRFRKDNEMVRVGNHIGLPPEFIEARIQELLIDYNSQIQIPFIHKIAQLHTEFESVYPFIDGNGRIGRVINNYLLIREGFPPIIVRNKEKESYYSALRSFDDSYNSKPMIRIVELAVLESLHKRLAYLDGLEIIPLSEYVDDKKSSFPAILNTARRQTIPAFREKGVWKIGKKKT
ncbi:cell filamentation protein Fic [Candidatus Roizmanbacteria bacterium CG_4_10_14_0_8_um_filter_39_9]|uniref:Cell filamentation protein Fic n=1 Tax=Candidatus Roizmanbacteria bacterium CG_4_10_14_0_8_um_filter_39_9 TaxID=1974829 RepID=A0A2M7QBG7_9BACT|nr:MAG: cell filamentation protein Fic [Candidatus Roizmanbacteria bacterium CG_4_10_14_0_8_um_filter_39_9]